MSCNLYGSLSSDHLDGLLTHDEQMLLEAHLVMCRACRERHLDLQAMKSMFRQLDPVEPVPGLALRVEARLAREVESTWGIAQRWLAGLLPVGELLPSTTTAAIFLMFMVGVAWPRHLAFDRVEDPVRQASMLTVWDSESERIIASVDAGGFVGSSVDLDALASSVTTAVNSAGTVRIFLYESIIVRG